MSNRVHKRETGWMFSWLKRHNHQIKSEVSQAGKQRTNEPHRCSGGNIRTSPALPCVALIPWAQCLPQQEVWSPLAQESRLTLLTLFRARWVGNHTVHNHHNVDRFSSPWILEWRFSAIVHHLRHYTKRASSTIIHKCFSMLQFGSRQPAASNY